MTRVRYEIRVLGSLGPAAREAFDGLEIDSGLRETVLTGDLDQAALHGLINRIRALGLELMDIQRVRPVTAGTKAPSTTHEPP